MVVEVDHGLTVNFALRNSNILLDSGPTEQAGLVAEAHARP